MSNLLNMLVMTFMTCVWRRFSATRSIASLTSKVYFSPPSYRYRAHAQLGQWKFRLVAVRQLEKVLSDFLDDSIEKEHLVSWNLLVYYPGVLILPLGSTC